MNDQARLPHANIDNRVPYQIHGVFIPQVRLFVDAFSERVYPAFADPEGEAERVAQEYWDEQMGRPVDGDGDVDPGSVADDAHERRLEAYFRLVAMQVTVVDLFAAGLFHLLEQQVSELLRQWSVPPGREPLETLREVVTRQLGFDFGPVASWSRMQQLNDVANVVKHAEGPSAERLRKTRPELFDLPLARRPEYKHVRRTPGSHRPVVGPLTGEDLYVTKEDFDAYAEAVLDFWRWLSGEFERTSPIR